MDDMNTRKINHSETQRKTQIDETRQMNLYEIKREFISDKEERIAKTITLTEKLESLAESKDFYKLITRTQEGFKEYILDQENITFGRSQDCNIPLNDKIVSKYHSLIIVTKDECTLKDLDSKNGTYVNDLPIYRKKRLRHLDKIKIGETLFLFVDKDGTVILPDDFPLSEKKKDHLLMILISTLIASGILLIIVIIMYFYL